MSTVFSPMSKSGTTVAAVDLSKAPAPPVEVQAPSFDGKNMNGSIKLLNQDFDGSAATGYKNAYVFGAANNPDGTNPCDGLTAPNAIAAGFLKVKMDVTDQTAVDGTEQPWSFPYTPSPSGDLVQFFYASSDENG